MANYSSDVWSRWGPWALAVSWQLFFLRGKLRYEIVCKTSKTLKFRQDEFFFVLLKKKGQKKFTLSGFSQT
jgi:hypothetical protein